MKSGKMNGIGNYSAGLSIYCEDREKMIQECKNPIVEDDFHGFSHRNCEGTEQLPDYMVSDFYSMNNG